MILSGQTIRELGIVTPFSERSVAYGLSYGLSVSGFDIRLAERRILRPDQFCLGSSVEHFSLPRNVMGFLTDKSTNARRGLSLFNCTLEPGWAGVLTLELKNLGEKTLILEEGYPIAQIVFQYVDRVTSGYNSKYQNQSAGPQKARYE